MKRFLEWENKEEINKPGENWADMQRQTAIRKGKTPIWPQIKMQNFHLENCLWFIKNMVEWILSQAALCSTCQFNHLLKTIQQYASRASKKACIVWSSVFNPHGSYIRHHMVRAAGPHSSSLHYYVELWTSRLLACTAVWTWLSQCWNMHKTGHQEPFKIMPWHGNKCVIYH